MFFRSFSLPDDKISIILLPEKLNVNEQDY